METGQQQPRRSQWPVAFVILGLATLVAGVSIYFYQSTRNLISDLGEDGRSLVRDAASLVGAFRSGTVTTSFISYATEMTGSNYLQFATLEQVEIFERTDSVSVLWGQLELPTVVVRAEAPVEFTFYLDLDGHWEFTLEEEHLVVVQAPRIEHNTPAMDVSAIRYEVRDGSLFRDEEEAMRRLRDGLSALADHRATENVELVRELGRRQTADFIRNWLLQHYDEASKLRIEVRFADETPETARPGARFDPERG